RERVEITSQLCFADPVAGGIEVPDRGIIFSRRRSLDGDGASSRGTGNCAVVNAGRRRELDDEPDRQPLRMMLDRITPVLLTYNEAPNIGRTLDRLRWASDIVVVDSHSQDATLSILSLYPQCRVFQRPFDDFASQWEFAVTQTQINSDWVLALDADFVLTTELVDELAALDPSVD